MTGGCPARGRRIRLRRGIALAAVAMLAVSACTSADVLRPEIDVGQTASTPPRLAGVAEPAFSPTDADVPLSEPDIAPTDAETAMSEPPAEPDTGVDGNFGDPAPESDFGKAAPADEFGSRSLAADVEMAPASEPEPVSRPILAPEPVERGGPILAGYPRMDEPRGPQAMPAEELSCRKQLKKLRVAYTELDPINQGGACRIDHPVKISRIGNVAIKPAATLNCEMAEAFALWTRNELVPASRWRFFSAVKTIHQGSGYSCRNIAGTRTSSEHARGNAIDIMKLELGSGKMIDVRKPGLFAFRKRGLLNTVRADGCQYFTTVLGPGYNADHADHFHFDIKSRRNGYRACR